MRLDGNFPLETVVGEEFHSDPVSQLQRSVTLREVPSHPNEIIEKSDGASLHRNESPGWLHPIQIDDLGSALMDECGGRSEVYASISHPDYVVVFSKKTRSRRRRRHSEVEVIRS